MFTIKQLSAKYGFSEVYIRRSIANGSLKSTKVEMNENQFKHQVSEEQWNEFRATTNHSKREDGRSRFVLYANNDELETLMKQGYIIEKQKQYKSAQEAEEAEEA